MSLNIVNTFKITPPQPDFFDDYDSTVGWTQIGTTITIAGGEVGGTAIRDDQDARQHKSLGLTLDDTAWVCLFTYRVINNSQTSSLLNFTSGIGQPKTSNDQDMIGLSGNQDFNEINLQQKEQAGGVTISALITGLTLNETFFGTMTRTSPTQVTLAMFTDAERTNQTGPTVSITVASTLGGFNTIQHASETAGGGGTTGFFIEQVAVFNGVTTPP